MLTCKSPIFNVFDSLQSFHFDLYFYYLLHFLVWVMLNCLIPLKYLFLAKCFSNTLYFVKTVFFHYSFIIFKISRTIKLHSSHPVSRFPLFHYLNNLITGRSASSETSINERCKNTYWIMGSLSAPSLSPYRFKRIWDLLFIIIEDF